VTRDSTFGAGDIRATLPRFTPAALSSNLDLVDRITAIAARLPATPGQVALAWLLARKPWIVPIPGTRRIERLDENLAAAELDLSEDDLEELTVASDSVDVQGDRYPPPCRQWSTELDLGGATGSPFCAIVTSASPELVSRLSYWLLGNWRRCY
jgi:hypothetical protein